jgi:hypothetical protein
LVWDCDPPTSATQEAGIIGKCYHTQPGLEFCIITLSFVVEIISKWEETFHPRVQVLLEFITLLDFDVY